MLDVCFVELIKT